MLKNYVPRERKMVVEYEIAYDDGAGNGFGFPCDKDGNAAPDMHECAVANLEWCRQHPEKFVRAGEIVTMKRWHTEPAHGRCICGREVSLWDQYYGACECECGRWYNLFGQELVPPEHWETDPSEEEYYKEEWC